MTDTRTDTEILSSLMEAKPELRCDAEWWRWDWSQIPVQCRSILDVCPEIEKLGRLREIEEKLTEEKWVRYHDEIWARHCGAEHPTWKILIHLSPEQKISALGAVLRKEQR